MGRNRAKGIGWMDGIVIIYDLKIDGLILRPPWVLIKFLNITRDEGQKYWPDEKTMFHLFGRSKIPEIQCELF